MPKASISSIHRLSRTPYRLIVLFLLTLSALALMPSAAQAELASSLDMEQVCNNWTAYIVSQKGAWAGSTTPSITTYQDIIENDTLLGRCFTIASGGYVVVPVLKEMPPIAAYSDENPIDINEPGGFALLLHQVLQNRVRLFVKLYGSLDVPQSTAQPLFGQNNREEWNTYAVDPKEFSQRLGKSLTATLDGAGPLLTTAWHQGAPYNNLCPIGDGGRCVAGCVATAAAQIIWYHQWPKTGQGTHSYYWNGDNSCDGSTPGEQLTADFTHTYSYVDNATNVAQLSYDMGVAFDMMYGYCGSGAYVSDAPGVFTQYFRYDTSINIQDRSDYMPNSWFAMVKTEINQGRPILYGIYSHAIVCDGWQETIEGIQQYHFNYGWGGSHNAWYTLDELYCPWSGCSNDYETMVRRIIPLTGMPWMGSKQFSDALYGDNDGIPEAGEHIVLTFKIANYGAAPITGISATLAVDDNSLTIIKGSSSFGTIPARDSISNASDPMEFQIPADYIARTDSFVIYLTWNDSNIDTMVIEKNIGKTGVLLVDDDQNDNVDTYYKESLNHMRTPYDVWLYSAYQSPDSAYLSQYPVVIWFTGDYRYAPISTNEITAIEGYLHQGGNFLLSGQAIAYELSTANPDFLNNYLKASYQSTSLVPILCAESGGHILSTADSVSIQGGNGAGNQTNPDHILPVNDGVAECRYMNLSDYGAVSFSGNYKSFFLSFGAEAITNDVGRWITRDSVISKILSFFSYHLPSAPPSVQYISVTPGEQLHLIEHIPEIGWSISDPSFRPQLQYQVQVDDDSNWTSISSWDTGILAGSDTLIRYAGSELLDGAIYFIRVRVNNGVFWSNWRYTRMRLNSVAAPTILTPTAMQVTASTMPTLTVTNAADREGDILKYTFEVYGDSTMTNLICSGLDLSSGAYGKTSWPVPVALTDDAIYYWRARVFDGYEYGPWTGMAVFWVNSVNSPPSSCSLISPADNSSLVGGVGAFHWTQATDPDIYDHVRYTLYVSADSAFRTSLLALTLDTTGYLLTDPLVPGYTYFWKVKALDQLGAAVFSQQTFRFIVGRVGDANGDQSINVGDAVFVINYVFKSGLAPNPLGLADANCDSRVNVGDAVFLVNYVFKDGTAPGCQK